MTATGTNLRLSKTSLAKATMLERIRKGMYAPGKQIPPERTLAGEFGISRVLLGNMLRELAREGWLVRRTGSGTYVSENVPRLGSMLKRVAFVASNGANPVAQRILEGLHRPGNGEACDVMVKDPGGSPQAEQEAVRALLKSGVQGVVVVTCFPCGSADGLAFYQHIRKRIPVVLCDCEIRGDLPSVTTDNLRCGELAAEQLVAALGSGGPSWILCTSLALSSEANRMMGWERTLQTKGIEDRRPIMLPRNSASQKRVLAGALAEGKPAGVFVTSEILLPPFFEACAAAGIPRTGMSVCCCDNFHSWASLYGVPYIEQPIVEMAREAVRELDRQMRDPEGVVRHVRLAPRLVVP